MTAMRALRLVLVLALTAGTVTFGAAQEEILPPKSVGGAIIDALPLIGPYLLPTETPFKSVRVAFRGTAESTRAAGGTIHFGKANISERELGFAPAPKHVLDLTDLSPDCEYQYQLEFAEFRSTVYRFRTAPAPGTRARVLKVAVLMDVHAMEPLRMDLRNPASKPMFFGHCGAMVPDIKKFGPDIVILGGDLVDGVYDFEGTKDSMPGQCETLFRIFRELFASALVAPCPGNHEWGCGDRDLSLYADYFALPQNGPDDEKTNTWSFAYGGIGFQFRADDTPKTGRVLRPDKRNSQAPWIRENLKWLTETCRADTIIDVNHYPVFHWGDGKGGATQTPIVFDPRGEPGVTDIFDAAGNVRLALSGHTHMHQRTFPLLCEGGVRATTSGAVRLWAGHEGHNLHAVPVSLAGISGPGRRRPRRMQRQTVVPS